MNTEEERDLILETFIRAFSVSLQTLVPEKPVQELFISFVLSRLIIDEDKDPTLKLDEQFVYDCIPIFIDWLHTAYVEQHMEKL